MATRARKDQASNAAQGTGAGTRLAREDVRCGGDGENRIRGGSISEREFRAVAPSVEASGARCRLRGSAVMRFRARYSARRSWISGYSSSGGPWLRR